MKLIERKETLSAESIDRLSALTGEILAQSDVNRKDILRLRLSLEGILENWHLQAPGTELDFCTQYRFGRYCLEIKLAGKELSFGGTNEEVPFNGLLCRAGLMWNYRYERGCNCLSVYPVKREKMNKLAAICLSIMCALVLGNLAKLLPEAAVGMITAFTVPLFDTLLACLKSISSPMIFLALSWGIINIGNIGAAQKMGIRILRRMVLVTLFASLVCGVAVTFFYSLSYGDFGGTSYEATLGLYMMFLDIVPSDIVTPFQTGHALQIIFMGVFTGFSVLILGSRISVARMLIEQANEVVHFLMGLIGSFIPAFVFLSLFNIITCDSLAGISGLLKSGILIAAGCFGMLFVYAAALSLRFKIRPVLLAKKLLPTFIIAFTTASSAAAFGTNMKTCEEDLGIPGKVANFAVPMGQVLFMPGNVIISMVLALAMAEQYGVSISITWMISAILVSTLLAMAAIPIPGGALTCYTILFLQLGLPEEAVALAIAVDSVADFLITAVNLSALQMELVFAASGLGLLDGDTLRS